MAISDYLPGRGHARHGRSGLMSTSGHVRARDAENGPGAALAEEKIGPLGIVFVLLLAAAAVFVMDYGVLPPFLKEKDRAPYDVNARLEYQFNDPNELRQQRDDAARRAPRVYVETPDWTESVVADLKTLIGIVEMANNVSEAQDRAARFPQDKQLVEELFRYDEAGRRRKALSSVLLERIRLSLNILAANGILTSEDLKIERNKPGELREILRVVKRGNETREKRIAVGELTDVPHAAYEFEHAGSWKEGLPWDLERNLAAHLTVRMTNNLALDKEQTRIQMERARELAGSGDILVKKNEPILIKGQTIGRSELDRLQEEWRAHKRALSLEARVKHLLGLAGLGLSVLLTFIFLVARVDDRVFRRRRALVMLGLLALAALAGCKALLLAGYSLALAPFVFVGLVASLAFGPVVALLTLFGLTVLTIFAGIHWEAYPLEGSVPALALALLVGGVAASLPAARLRDRWDLLKYAIGGGLIQFVLAAALSQLGEGRVGVPSLTDALLALLNGPVYGLLVLGSLPLIEAIFGILTNIRLFELADMNQPAARRIQLESPGTFAHTLQVRNLAEPAAEAIGANTRLVSAGVLYHDLGKTLKPEYFVENQMDAEERHRRLRPSVSALLITAHVKDGIELAHEYGLPQQIIDFIPEHHGTTLVSYFYHSAKKDAEGAGEANGESVQEAFFRYPGPRPQSRETAITMLADTVEAASRTLANPSAARLRGFVHELIMEKMLDGQLDECDLTFAELALIEEAFLRVLVTRYHSRVRYPGQEEEALPRRATNSENRTTIMEVPPGGSPVPPPDGVTSPPPQPRELMTETRLLSRRPSSKGEGSSS